MIQQTLYQALSPLVAGHCFYEVIPDTHRDFPVIVYQFPNISPNSALEDGDLDDYTVQVDVYSPNQTIFFICENRCYKRSVPPLNLQNGSRISAIMKRTPNYIGEPLPFK